MGKSFLKRRRLWTSIILLVLVGIAGASGLIAISKNAGGGSGDYKMVATNSPTPVMEETLENKGTIYVPCESDEATIFLLKKKMEDIKK